MVRFAEGEPGTRIVLNTALHIRNLYGVGLLLLYLLIYFFLFAFDGKIPRPKGDQYREHGEMHEEIVERELPRRFGEAAVSCTGEDFVANYVGKQGAAAGAENAREYRQFIVCSSADIAKNGPRGNDSRPSAGRGRR